MSSPTNGGCAPSERCAFHADIEKQIDPMKNVKRGQCYDLFVLAAAQQGTYLK
ncbi:hypothetical protein OH764_32910 (plasmid) [Burkholderia sp. M6-3]